MDTAWRKAPATLSISSDEAHVWRVELAGADARVGVGSGTLSPEEQDRAGRFRFDADRGRYVAAHVALRSILARYVGAEPGALRFSCTENGKPELASHLGSVPLRFNLSHSHDLALVAVTLGRAVGVDVEHLRRDVSFIEVAEHFFAPQEVAVLRGLEPERRAEAFFNCWTQKEAFVKALGEGLSHPLDQFEVACAPGASAGLLRTLQDPSEAGRWTLLALTVGDEYSAALAVHGAAPSVRCRRWEG